MKNAKKINYNDYTYINDRQKRLKKLAMENEYKLKKREKIINVFSTLTLYCFGLVLIFSLAYILIQRNSLISKSKIDSMDLESKIEEKNLELENLESEISVNLDLNMIENKAIKDLNMMYPDRTHTVYIKKNITYSLNDENENDTTIVGKE